MDQAATALLWTMPLGPPAPPGCNGAGLFYAEYYNNVYFTLPAAFAQVCMQLHDS